MVTLLGDGAMKAVINVDYWRFLMPYELNRLVEESLRIAPELILVQTHRTSDLEGLMSSCSTVEYIADMLSHRLKVTPSAIDGADVLRIK